MKQLTFYLTILIISTQLFGGTKTISIDFELSETAINRAIVSQFNEPNFAFKHFTGQFTLNGVPNVSYSVELARPTIVIETNSIGINMAFTFEASIGGVPYNYEFNITPSISIDGGSINGSNVVAYLDNLDDEIDATNMEWEIKALLIGLYNVFKPQIYAAELYNEILEEINSNEFIAQRAFSITDIGIGADFNAGKFVVKALVDITYENTWFNTRLSNRPTEDFLLIYSNIKTTIAQIKVWDGGNDLKVNVNDANIEMVKNSDGNYEAEVSLNNILSSQNYTWVILFKTNTTFYLKKYGPVPPNNTIPPNPGTYINY